MKMMQGRQGRGRRADGGPRGRRRGRSVARTPIQGSATELVTVPRWVMRLPEALRDILALASQEPYFVPPRDWLRFRAHKFPFAGERFDIMRPSGRRDNTYVLNPDEWVRIAAVAAGRPLTEDEEREVRAFISERVPHDA